MRYSLAVKRKAFRMYVELGLSLTEISKELGVTVETLSNWKRKSIPDNWEVNRKKKRKKKEIIKTDDDYHITEHELLKIKNIDRMLKLGDRNWSNFALALQSISNKLIDMYNNNTLKNLSFKEFNILFQTIERILGILDKLFVAAMPAPKGFILINEVDEIYGMFYKYIMKKIADNPAIDSDVKLELMQEVATFAERQLKNLNMRKDLTTLTMEEGKELILKANREHNERIRQKMLEKKREEEILRENE